MRKIFLGCLVLMFVMTGCGPSYKQTFWEDPNWPRGTISKLNFDWPSDNDNPTIVFESMSEDQKYNVFFIVAFVIEGPRAGIIARLGWKHGSAPSFGPDDIHMKFQRNPDDAFDYYSQMDSDGGCSLVADADPAEENQLHQILSIAAQVVFHFNRYPNDEIPIPAYLRDEIQDLLKKMFTLPPKWQLTSPCN